MYAKKPIFIVASPRSGSTLLFETLMRHRQLWSFGDEGHAWIEKYPRLRPLPGGVASNRLTKEDLLPGLAEQLRFDMLIGMHNAKGDRINADTCPIRIIEKTPKNCLRIPFIDAIYPDAIYIYLYRDPKDSISSIIEGWRHQRFVTYGDVRFKHGRWCFLRPPKWRDMLEKELHEIAAYQWQSCQDIIIDDLASIDRKRWITCSFNELVDKTQVTMRRLQSFCELAVDLELDAYCAEKLPNSRYTQTPPAIGKWLQNKNAITEIFPTLLHTLNRINKICEPDYQLATQIPVSNLEDQKD